MGVEEFVEHAEGYLRFSWENRFFSAGVHKILRDWAKEACKLAIETDASESNPAYSLMKRATKSMSDYIDNLVFYKQMVEEHPKDNVLLTEYYLAGLELDPKNHELHFKVGQLLSMQGKLKGVRGAEYHFRKAATYVPDNPEYNKTLAKCIERAGNDIGAKFYMRRVPQDI